MAIRVYVLLWDEEHIYFPIARRTNQYHTAGDPQFFGGGLNAGESHFAALQRELDEESDHQLYLVGRPELIHVATVNADTLYFYATDGFGWRNGFLGELQNDEMQEIRSFSFDRDSDVIELGNFSANFGQSQTCAAFEHALAACARFAAH